MILAIDIGNTNIVLGGYFQGKMQFLARVVTDKSMEADQYAVQFHGMLKLYNVTKENIRNVVVASVVPALTPVVMRALKHFFDGEPHLLTLADADEVEVVIDNPAELGTDILASAIAVRHGWPLPAIIIDMGTATKITALDANGRLLGVAISPGLFVSLNALVQRASALRDIPLEAPPTAIGRNTPHSMKSGVVLGTAAMLDGMIDRFEEEMGKAATIIATGGGAPVVVPHCLHKVEIKETLLLDGLRQVVTRIYKEQKKG